MIQVRTPFRSTDAGRGQQLIDALDQVRAKVIAAHPSVRIGFTGSVITAVAEHGAIFRGMVMSSAITMLLVRGVARAVLPQRHAARPADRHARDRDRDLVRDRGAHRRAPQRGDRVPRRDHRGQRRQLRDPLDRALPRGAPDPRRRGRARRRDRRDAAPDRDRLARRGDRVWLARRDQLQGLRRLRDHRRDRDARVLGRLVRVAARPDARAGPPHPHPSRRLRGRRDAGAAARVPALADRGDRLDHRGGRVERDRRPLHRGRSVRVRHQAAALGGRRRDRLARLDGAVRRARSAAASPGGP